MIKLVAALYNSGLVCIIFKGNYLFFKPPYDKDKFCLLTKKDISRAIVDQGFQAEDKEFASFKELFAYLREKALKGEGEVIINRE